MKLYTEGSPYFCLVAVKTVRAMKKEKTKKGRPRAKKGRVKAKKNAQESREMSQVPDTSTTQEKDL